LYYSVQARFQDLQSLKGFIEKQRVTDTTSSVFGGFGNERVRDVFVLSLDPARLKRKYARSLFTSC